MDEDISETFIIKKHYRIILTSGQISKTCGQAQRGLKGLCREITIFWLKTFKLMQYILMSADVFKIFRLPC